MNPIQMTPVALLGQYAKENIFILGQESREQISDSKGCRITLERKIDRFYLGSCPSQAAEGVVKGLKKIVVKNIVKEFVQILSEEIKTVFADRKLCEIFLKHLKPVWAERLNAFVQRQQDRSVKEKFVINIIQFFEELPDIDRVALLQELHGYTIFLLCTILIPLKVSDAMRVQLWKNCRIDIGHIFFRKKWDRLDSGLAKKYEPLIEAAFSNQAPTLEQILPIFQEAADSFSPKILKAALSNQYSALFDIFLNHHYVETPKELENFRLLKDDLLRILYRLSNMLCMDEMLRKEDFNAKTVLAGLINLIFHNFTTFTCNERTSIDNKKIADAAAKCMSNIQSEQSAYRRRYKIRHELLRRGVYFTTKSLLGGFELTDKNWAVSLFAVDSSTPGDPPCDVQAGHAMICVEGVQHGEYFRN